MTEKTKKWSKVLAAVALAVLVYWAITSTGKVKRGAGINGSLAPQSSPLMEKVGKSPMAEDSFSRSSAPDMEMAQAPMEANEAGSGDSLRLSTDRKIVKNGSLSLQVSDLDESVDKISSVAQANGGLVYSSNIYAGGGGVRPLYDDVRGYGAMEKDVSNLPRSGSVTIKVPADKFSQTMDQLKEVASQVLSVSTNTDDITETYVDLEAQLKNKRAEEEAFNKLLQQATDVEDILAVTKQTSRVRGEIERLEAQKRFYDSQTAMSQITVSMNEDSKVGPIKQDWRPWQTVKDSTKALIKNFQNGIDDLIYFVIAELPGILLTLLIIFIAWKIGKKVYLKIKGKQDN